MCKIPSLQTKITGQMDYFIYEHRVIKSCVFTGLPNWDGQQYSCVNFAFLFQFFFERVVETYCNFKIFCIRN